MTDITEIDQKCSVCEKISKQPVLLSSNQFGYQDLDTRPSEMYRDTMNTWIVECPHCGYVAHNLEENLSINSDYLKEDEYKTCENIEFKSEISKIFYKRYLIEKKKEDDISAFFTILQCAWTCDDAKDLKNIKYTRQIAVKIADNIIKNNSDDLENFIVMKADLLRRCGEFDRLINEYENITLDDDLLNRIIRFEVEKAQEKDDDCYTLKEVL